MQMQSVQKVFQNQHENAEKKKMISQNFILNK